MIVFALTVATVLLVALAVSMHRHRRTLDRIHEVVARLTAGPSGEPPGLEAAIRLLEQWVDAVVSRDGEESTEKARFGHALSAIHDGIVLFAADGEIAFSNPCAEVFLGARHGDAIVESTIKELALTATAGGDQEARTLELFGPPRRTLVLSSQSLDDGRRGIGALVVIEDVTERHRIDAVRRDFVANISHELKTPVGGIGVLAETLLEEGDPTIMRRIAQRMHLEAMRASRTIDDLLALSQIESGEPVLAESIAVHSVLAEAVDRASTAAEQRDITVQLRGPDRPIEVDGDRRQLVSAVFNLLDNAIKYSAPGSTVTVSSDTRGDEAHLTVTDRGIGIPRRDLGRIFERFYRVDRARSRETGGTGLGLAIVRHVAANHGGDVTVNSREGHGTTFDLVVPISARTPLATIHATG